MFIVLEQDALVSGAIGDGNGTYIVDRTPETNNLMSLKITNGTKFAYQKRNNNGDNLEGPVSATDASTGIYNIINFSRTYNTSYDIYLDGRLDATLNTNKSDQITGPRLQLGRHAVNANQGLQGRIAEVVLYNAALSTANRRRVESYLALKYGITLDQTTRTDYVNSSGTVIYPVASDASYDAYRYDIAGIGQDNNSALNQTSSKSQNTGAMVQISNPSSMGTGDFLVWGNNNGNLSTRDVADVGGAVQARLSRVWRVAHTNNLGTVTVSIDMTNVPGSITGSDLRLLIDRNGNGFSDNDVTPRSGTLTGSSFVVTGVTLQNGDYFTVGSVDKSSTPLPVELLEFTLTAREASIDVSWSVSMERNNDYFFVERSVEGEHWTEAGRVKSYGDTHTTHHYSISDDNRATGLFYYRLSQTDHGGATTTFPVKSILVSPRRTDLAVYPNPGDGLSVNLACAGEMPASIQCVEVLNQEGMCVGRYGNSQIVVNGADRQLVFDRKLTAGFYYLKITYDNTIAYIKICVL